MCVDPHGRTLTEQISEESPEMARAARICPGFAGERCTQLIRPPSPRCPDHARAYERARGSASKRGLGHAHRTHGDRAIRGATHCVSCRQPFTSANPATRGHARARRRGGTHADGYVAQCQRCNYGWKRTGL